MALDCIISHLSISAVQATDYLPTLFATRTRAYVQTSTSYSCANTSWYHHNEYSTIVLRKPEKTDVPSGTGK
jgi:hypothetical protein